MGLLGGNKPGAIGIDLGGRTIKAVQLAGPRSNPRMHAAAVLPLPVPSSE